jgi:hypothetical protein
MTKMSCQLQAPVILPQGKKSAVPIADEVGVQSESAKKLQYYNFSIIMLSRYLKTDMNKKFFSTFFNWNDNKYSL